MTGPAVPLSTPPVHYGEPLPDTTSSKPGGGSAGRFAHVAIAVFLAASAGGTSNTDRPLTAYMRGTGDASSAGTTFLASGAPQRGPASPSVAQTVRDLRDLSGLTWEQLSRLFGVSRRAVHHWANGGKMTSRHVEILTLLMRRLNELPAASTADRRDTILRPQADGRSLFDELRAELAANRPAINSSPLEPDQLLGDRPIEW